METQKGLRWFNMPNLFNCSTIKTWDGYLEIVDLTPRHKHVKLWFHPWDVKTALKVRMGMAWRVFRIWSAEKCSYSSHTKTIFSYFSWLKLPPCFTQITPLVHHVSSPLANVGRNGHHLQAMKKRVTEAREKLKSIRSAGNRCWLLDVWYTERDIWDIIDEICIL